MKLLFFLRDLLRPISVTAITLFLLFIAQPLVAQYKEDVPDMVDQAVANLFVTLGYDRQQIVYELYGNKP